jgi:hypothetical protein
LKNDQLLLRMFWNDSKQAVLKGEFQKRHDVFDHQLSGPKKDNVETLEELLEEDTYGGELLEDEIRQLIAFEREVQKMERDKNDREKERWRRLLKRYVLASTIQSPLLVIRRLEFRFATCGAQTASILHSLSSRLLRCCWRI